MNLRDQYKGILHNDNLSVMDKKSRIDKLYTKNLVSNTPPHDGNYDNYGSHNTFRLRKNGLYPEIKLAVGEKPQGDTNKFANAISNPDTVCIADIMINQFSSRTAEIVKLINNRCYSSGNLLLIGNVLHPDVAKAFTLLLGFLSNIRTTNVYLILGKYDAFSVSDYISFGFTYVTDRAEKTIDGKKVIFTYYPVPLLRDQYNIHGALMGGAQYSHMSKDNHYDAYIKDGSQQLKIRTIGEILKDMGGGN